MRWFVTFEDGYHCVVRNYDNKTAVRRNLSWMCRMYGKIESIEKV